MKKVVTGIITGLALITLAGCGTSSSTKSESDNSSQAVASSKKAAIDNAEAAVISLFNDQEQDHIAKNLSLSKVAKVKAIVDSLPSGKAKNEMLKSIKNAKSQVIAAAEFSEDNKKSNASESKREASKEKEASISQSQSFASHKSSVAASKSKSKAKKSSTATTSVKSRYKKISLEDFATNPEKYEGKDIETSGHVTYVQKKPDDPDVYYVAILPKDNYSSSGYSFGSVTEVNIDTMQETPIHVGDNITVRGSGLTGGVQFRGKTLRADIVVDDVTIN
ncbi:Lipoprotein [Lactobacillus plantarum ZJ316] [Lactiplantibacillus mudanjiangensis]|uniref:toxin Cry1Ac domain D-VI-related protein n=1 Tax=Lactiplantibacillus mudanjiangensis TaxID=1296538 RepID=UPI0010146B0D|nr:toxin Cry1Ac domain D-VI-related protein [Lactiplantibacillus mudanjiangensis]VDG33329.1 Lipoprotein [Lactobacillus plantarum ZJ316] [Lactiplantibacillus mudanjiangensis]